MFYLLRDKWFPIIYRNIFNNIYLTIIFSITNLPSPLHSLRSGLIHIDRINGHCKANAMTYLLKK